MDAEPHVSAAEDPHDRGGIGLVGLIALVISSSIGSGVFALSSDIAAAASPGAAIIAWAITGIGFIALATTFGTLSIARPDLDGIVAYADEGFGPFVGFISGWGYWLSILIGNVAFGVMLATAIGYFYPPFSGGLTVGAVAFISVVNWLIILLVNHGVEEASVVNAIVMVCKLLPIFAFIATMILVFSFDVFDADFWGTLANNIADEDAPGSVGEQIVNCFMVMMWVFVGMEGATVLGHRARDKRNVSRATVLGTLALVGIYIAASVLPYGYLPREELMNINSPAMAYIFQDVVGSWGGAFISGGLVISIFGAWLSYTILASETMNRMARMALLPRMFSRFNAKGSPTACLVVTGCMIQVLSIVVLFSEEAYQFAYSLCTASIVVSWALAAAYMVRLALPQAVRAHTAGSGDVGTGAASATTGSASSPSPLDHPRLSCALALFATVFLAVAVVLAGIDLLMLCCIAYAPGFAFYRIASREYERRAFKPWEAALAIAIITVALATIGMLAAGILTI